MSSNPQPSGELSLTDRIRLTSTFQTILRNTSIGMLIISPVIIALPPRKLDLYTLALSGAWVASASHLVKERTGKGMLEHLPRLRSGGNLSQDVEEASDGKTRLLEEHTRQTQRGTIEEQLAKHGLRPAKEDWKEQRLREEREKLEDGEGYGGMIMDQIWEVWNQGEKKAEEIKAIDERIVGQKKMVEFDAKRSWKRELEFPEIGRNGQFNWR